jgi:hypothetical protein
MGNNLTVTVSSSPTGATLSDAREAVKIAVQDLPGVTVGSGTDGLKRLDYAIRGACSEFIRRTGCNAASGTANATPDSEALSLASLARFSPAYLTRVTATHPTTGRIYPVDVTNYRDLLLSRNSGDAALQFPYVDLVSFNKRTRGIAFKDEDNAVLWPTPDVAWVYTFYYSQPLTSWTIGTASPASVAINIPNDMIDGVLWYGVPAYFENPNPANRYQDSSRRRFEQHIAVCRGATGLTKVVQANPRDYQ